MLTITLYEMAQAAADNGLALYGCTEHAPAMPAPATNFILPILR